MTVKVVTWYALFAAFATVANIATQYVTVLCYSGSYALGISIALGTCCGLALKYILDKRFIFQQESRSLAQEGNQFFLYSLMGIITTLIYLFTELAFEIIFDTLLMRYIGAALGLAIGYLIKYQLDKRYVFTTDLKLT